MRTRTSIELYPGGCRLVAVVPAATGRRAAARADIRVTAALTGLPGDDDALLADALRTARVDRRLPLRAVVTIWGLRSTQHLLRLPPATPADLELLATRESRKDIAALESDGVSASVAVALGDEVQVGTHRRREVSLVAVSGADVRRRIQPLVDAGFVVDCVLSPALALADLARTDADVTPGTTAAYVALTPQATCVAIVRDGLLLFAREMSWGYDTAGEAGGEPIAARLAAELRRSILFFKQTFRAPVEAAVLCGDMPHLRRLTAPIGDALTLPVHALDSRAGLDVTAIPGAAGHFRGDIAALRLAIAAGARTASANLVPAAMLQMRQTRVQTIRIAAATAAAVLVLGAWYSVLARTATSQERERQGIEQQLAVLEPEAARSADLRRAYTVTTARGAAVTAFRSQGPRLARVLEAISQAASRDVVLTGIVANADGARWRVSVTGVAVTGDAASGQAALNAFLAALADSPFVGATVEPPALKVISGGGNTASREPVKIPGGSSGVEFTAHFMVAR